MLGLMREMRMGRTLRCLLSDKVWGREGTNGFCVRWMMYWGVCSDFFLPFSLPLRGLAMALWGFCGRPGRGCERGRELRERTSYLMKL